MSHAQGPSEPEPGAPIKETPEVYIERDSEVKAREPLSKATT